MSNHSKERDGNKGLGVSGSRPYFFISGGGVRQSAWYGDHSLALAT